MRCEGKFPTRQAGIFEHRPHLSFEECGIEEEKERSRGIENVDGGDIAVREIFLGEQHRLAVEIGDQTMCGESLPVGKHCQLAVAWAAGVFKIGCQFVVVLRPRASSGEYSASA